MKKPKENEISHLFHKGSDLRDREEGILQEVSSQLGFQPQDLLLRSSWWGSKEIGAFHYKGQFEGKPAVLKIQGVKPEASEAYMISSFERTNKSKVIRPPHLYSSLLWDEVKRYEALILEDVGDTKVISLPATEEEIDRFFELYQDYRKNCRQEPWLEKPEQSISERVKGNFRQWRDASLKLYPNHPYRREEDENLIDKAIETLVKGYQDVEPEFQHAHLGDSDLYQVENNIVLLSNLYWSWRAPFYDAVMGYHWYIYHLGSVEGIIPEQIEQQRGLWLNHIQKLTQTDDDNRLLNLALLERAAAGLNIDALSSDLNKPISAYLVEATRRQVENLIAGFNNN